MQPTIAFHNCKLLEKLEPHQKITSDGDGRMYIDDRYFTSIRRTITRDSRDTLIELLQQTFTSSTLSNVQKVQLAAKLANVLKITYPDYEPLKTALSRLLHASNYSEGRSPNGSIEEIKLDKLNPHQLKLIGLRCDGRLSDGVWNLLSHDSWVSGAVCDFIIAHANTMLLFDVYMHQRGVKCRLSLLDPISGERRYEDVNSDSVKRLKN